MSLFFMESVSNQNRALPTLWWIRATRLAVLCFLVSLEALTVHAFTAADANAIFEAHTKAFYRVTNGAAWHLCSCSFPMPFTFPIAFPALAGRE